MSVLLDPSNNERGLVLVEELGTESDLGRFLGEVDDREVCDECDDASQEPLHDEDPAPSGQTGHDAFGCRRVGFGGSIMGSQPVALTETSHVRYTIGEDTGEGGRHRTDEVE